MATTYKRVAGGEGSEVLLVSSEAGSGKTTLVAEAARAASAEGAWVALGHCDEEVSRPYQPLSEALSHLVIHAPDSLLAAHVAEHGSELSRLVPALSRRLPELPPSRGTDADTERYLFFAATVGLLALVSQESPVVLVLDDLQWADTASLQLLRHLAGADAAMRLLVIGVYRDSDLSPVHPLVEQIAALRRESRVSRIVLPDSTTPGCSRTWRRLWDTALIKTASAWPTPCTGRPTATPSSSGRSCVSSPRPASCSRPRRATGRWARSCLRWHCPKASARFWGARRSPRRDGEAGSCLGGGDWRRVRSRSCRWRVGDR